MFAGLTDVVASVLAGRTHHHLMPSRPEPAAIRLHVDVAEAVCARDAAWEEVAMREILAEAMEQATAADEKDARGQSDPVADAAG